MPEMILSWKKAQEINANPDPRKTYGFTDDSQPASSSRLFFAEYTPADDDEEMPPKWEGWFEGEDHEIIEAENLTELLSDAGIMM